MNVLLEVIFAICMHCVKIQSQITRALAKMDLQEMVFHVKVIIFLFLWSQVFLSEKILNHIKFQIILKIT